MQHQKWAAISAAFAVATAVHAQVTYYVDDDAPAGGDGLSWYSAFNDLQDALDAAHARNFHAEIRLAGGVYVPDRGTGDQSAVFLLAPEGSDDPASSFTLQIRGGFAGLGHANPDWNDPSEFVSVLSGDLLGNDDGTPESRSDNSSHVAAVQASGWYVILDSLVIQGGQTQSRWPPSDLDGLGAGLHISQQESGATVSLRRVSFLGCSAEIAGGALYCGAGNVIVEDCSFAGNDAGGGGAVAVSPGSNVLITNNRFQNCSALQGGAIAAWGGGVAEVLSSTFLGNLAHWDAAAIYSESSVTVRGSLISGSIGSAVAIAGGDATFEASTIVHSVNAARAAVEIEGHAELVGCIIWSNSADSSPAQLYLAPGSTAMVRESCIQDGFDGVAGDTLGLDWDDSVIATDPLFVNEGGADGDPLTWSDNDYSLTSASPCIDAVPLLGPYFEPTLSDVRPFAANCSCKAVVDMGAYEFTSTMCLDPAPIIFVKADAAPGGDGRSWDTAFANLDVALSVPGVNEIWIAEGVYFGPSTGFGLELSCAYSTRLLGGFAGDETSEHERDPASHPTVITGDRLQNDNDSLASRADNDHHAFVSSFGIVTLDGLVVRDFGKGGASPPDPIVRFQSGSLALRNVRFERNMVRNLLRADDATLAISDCAWELNSGNLISTTAWTTVTNSTFVRNGWRFGTKVIDAVDGTLTHSWLVGNNAPPDMVRFQGDSTVFGCVFLGNNSTQGGPLLHVSTSGMVLNSAFASNYVSVTSSGDGLGLFENCWVWDASHSGPQTLAHQVRYSLLRFPMDGEGNVIQSGPRLVRMPSAGPDEDWGTSDDDWGDFRPRDGSRVIDAGTSEHLPPSIVGDLLGASRLVDDPDTDNTGRGYPPIDIGPVERQSDWCPGDWNADGVLTISDAIAFLGYHQARSPMADLNADEAWDFYDVQIFLSEFSAGCP